MSSFKTYEYSQKAPKSFEAQEWATEEELAPFGEADETQAIILGKGANIACPFRGKDFLHATNGNVMVIGGSGSGKTRSAIIPNMLNHQPVTYVITDTKGEISKLTVDGLLADGYEVTTLDTIDIAKSAHFDPLRYVKTDEDIITISELLYYSVRSGGKPGYFSSNDQFWDESAKLFFRALLGLLRDLERIDGALTPEANASTNRKYLTMNRLLSLTQMLCISESDEGEGASPLDYFIQGVRNGGIEMVFFEGNPSSYGIEQYNDFRVAAGRTLKSILITLNAALTKLRGVEMQELFSDDEMRFEEIGTSKRVIVLKMSDCDSSKSFLAQIALRLLIQQAFKAADGSPDGKLRVPVQFILDEFPNVGEIPDFPRIISTARSRNMNFLICAQSLAQIEQLYGTSSLVIMDNCDTLVYMGGGSSISTAEYISRLCGKARVGTGLFGIEHNERAILDDVITPSDLRLLPRTECIVMISGCKPFRTQKYDGYQHPNAAKFLTVPEE